jgi:hypothetical protein
LGLGLDPALDSGAQAIGAGIGHPQFLAAAIGTPFHHIDEALALQRQDISSEGRPIHY